MANTAKPKSSKSSAKKSPLQAEVSGIRAEIEGDVHAFWEAQAEEHGASDLATNPDQNYRKLEINSILRVIGSLEHDSILDVGCGNGFTTKSIAKKFPEASVTGVDFSSKMIEEAKRANLAPNIDYFDGDVLALSRNPNLSGAKFDIVVSTRCLINLSNWDEQKIGILEMRKMLKPDGRLILVENTKEGLDNLNFVRKAVGLEPIKTRWHNQYIPEPDLKKFLSDNHGHLFTQEYVENIGNIYYLISRVLYAKMCKDEGVEPEYSHKINEIAAQLPTMGEFYSCSPNFMIILKNGPG